MNTLVVFVGPSIARFPAPSWEFHVRNADAATPHAQIARNAIVAGFSQLVVLAEDATPSTPRFAEELRHLLDTVRGDPGVACVLLGGEHYGPLIPWHSGLKLCTASAGKYAFVVQGSGLRALASGGLPRCAFAVFPSMVHCVAVPPSSLCKRLPFAFPPGARRDHRALLKYLEQSWQMVLNGGVAYLVFSMLAAQLKAALRGLVS